MIDKNLQRFKDKVVIVTGSSRGIGRATAIAFAQEGAKVVVNYNKGQQAAKSVLEIIGSNNGITVQADVSKEEGVKRLINEAVTRFGSIDILVNNAGIVFDIPFIEKAVEQWNQILGVNLIGSFLCSKYAALQMRDGGRIINISSTNGIYSMGPESMDYDASKAGVIAMTKALAQELAPRKILVNAIAPGWVNTDMNRGLPKDFVKRETNRVYLKRFAEPEEIAKAILFLASDEASFINGSTLIVDGGY